MYYVLYFTPLTLTQSHPIRSLDSFKFFLLTLYIPIYISENLTQIFDFYVFPWTHDTLIFSVWFFAINLVSPLFDFEYTQLSHQNATVHSFSFHHTHTSWQFFSFFTCVYLDLIHCCLFFFWRFSSIENTHIRLHFPLFHISIFTRSIGPQQPKSRQLSSLSVVNEQG